MLIADNLITIFGGAGYIGSALVPLLLQEGYPVRVVDNFLFSSDGVKHLRHPLLEVIEGDIGDTNLVSSTVEGSEIVILLAALSGHRVYDIKWDNARIVNLLASSVVLDAALEHGASRFIFASTDSVYGVQTGVIYETQTPEPVSFYARLKLRMEERVLAAKRRNFHPTALRFANCHGFAPRMRFDVLPNRLIRDAECRKHAVLGNNEQIRSLVHVEDAARAVKQCVQAHENLVSGEVFNVGSGQTVQLIQLANIVKGLIPEATVEFLGEQPDLVDYHLNCSKLEKILDFKPQWTIEQSLAQLRDMLREGYFENPFSLKYRNT